MNRRGFTLVELLGVIIILAIVLVIVIPNVLENLNKGKEGSYDILLDNIITASISLYEECEYNSSVYNNDSDLSCPPRDNSITITLQKLVDYGFLSGSSYIEQQTTGKKLLNPKTEEDIGDCEVTINKSCNSNYVCDYTVTSKETVLEDATCPSEEELKMVREKRS